MNRIVTFIFAVGLTLFGLSCQKDTVTGEYNEEYFAGGETTIFTANSFAFSTPAPNLSPAHLAEHLEGDAQFEISFVSSPANAFFGLGPVFNNKSCVSCHPSDGRAKSPEDPNEFSGFFFPTSIPGNDVYGGPKPIPGYGTQIQNQAIFGVSPEALFEVKYTEIAMQYPDGEKVLIRKPEYDVSNPYVSLPHDALFSPRIAPPVFGLGLLEAIPEATIMSLADEFDANGDGISGRPNIVWDPELKKNRLGRFGWKANSPSVLVQTAGAYNGDMGITSPLFPSETCTGQINCDTLSDDPEIDQNTLELVTFYLKTLAVPAPRNLDDPKVRRGRELFYQIDCASCHTPEIENRPSGGYP